TTDADPAGDERERAAETGRQARDGARGRAGPVSEGGSELLSAGRYSVQDGPDEHGAFAGGSSPVPGAPDRGIRGIAAGTAEDSRGNAEVRAAGTDARQVAGDGADAEEDGIRHTDARLVPGAAT